jgi:predicted membrane protein
MIMDFMFTKMFWGVLIMLLGLYVILNSVFKIQFPLFKVLLAFFLIFIGFRMLFSVFSGNSSTHKMEGHAIFSDSNQKIGELVNNSKYETVFGSQKIDLRETMIPETKSQISFSCVFGYQEVSLPKNANIRVKASAVFGSVNLPNGGKVSFGDYTYTNAKNELAPTLEIDADCVFGNITFLQ